MTAVRLSVLVRGAGVAGLCCAAVLAESGVAVVVAEAGDRVGSGASWKAGGMLAPWCEAETAPVALQDIAGSAVGWWRQRVADAVANGTLVLALTRDTRELDRFARRTGHFRELDSDGIAHHEPDLAGRFRRGLFFADEGHLDPRTALEDLAKRVEQFGGRFLYLHPDLPERSFDYVIDARGMGAAGHVPGLRGVRGEMLLVRCPDVTLQRPVRLLHPRYPIYVVPRADHVFMIGATMLEAGHAGAIQLRSAVDLMNAAYALHPAFGDAELLEASADTRPSLPGNMPEVSRNGRHIMVNGMYRHGFLLAPGLAEGVRTMIIPD